MRRGKNIHYMRNINLSEMGEKDQRKKDEWEDKYKYDDTREAIIKRERN